MHKCVLRFSKWKHYSHVTCYICIREKHTQFIPSLNQYRTFDPSNIYLTNFLYTKAFVDFFILISSGKIKSFIRCIIKYVKRKNEKYVEWLHIYRVLSSYVKLSDLIRRNADINKDSLFLLQKSDRDTLVSFDSFS